MFIAPSPAAGSVISAARFCGNQTFVINATGVSPITITAIGIPLSTADLQFTGGVAVPGRLWTTATIILHPVSAFMSTVVTFQAMDTNGQSTLYSLAFTSTASDVNPPVTKAVTTPANLTQSPVSSAAFVLTSTDDCSGVQTLHYFIDGVPTIIPFASAAFLISTPGVHNVSWYATDVAGNNETLHTVIFTVIAASSGLGDPQFIGLRGQSFQIHGIDGAVYAIVSSHSTQINAHFVFLTEGQCPIIDGAAAANCWSHPGSYMGEVGFVQVVDGRSHTVKVVSGGAKDGFASVEVDGKRLVVGEEDQATFGSALSVQLRSRYSLLVRVAEFELSLSNSDKFVNIDELTPLLPLTQLSSHGLLGQTHSSKVYPNAILYIEGEVDDYLIADGQLLGHDFLFNQFKQIDQ